MKLYVDCDGTLVHWLSSSGSESAMHPYGAGADSWEPNQDVIRFIEHWMESHPDGELVVWSGGGLDYATRWGQRLLPHVKHTAAPKFNAIPGPGDLFIDDMPFEAWAHRCIHPDMCAVPN